MSIPFSPIYRLTPLILRQLLVIDQAAGFVKAVRLKPQWLADLHNTALVPEAVSSLQIEGNTISLETAFDLAISNSSSSELSNNEREFLNYLHAFDAISSLAGDKEHRVSIGDLLNLQGILMEGVRGGSRSLGQLRRESVGVGDIIEGETVIRYQPPHWSEVEEHLRALFDWINRSVHVLNQREREKGSPDFWVHSVVIAAIVHHRLVWIHPFVDGNGRTARMFATMLLHWRGYDFKCLFSLSQYYNQNRDKYYSALRSVDQSDDYTSWLEYNLGGFSRQMRAVQAKALKAADGVATQEAEETA